MAKKAWIERNKKKAADGEEIRRASRRIESERDYAGLRAAAQRQPDPVVNRCRCPAGVMAICASSAARV